MEVAGEFIGVALYLLLEWPGRVSRGLDQEAGYQQNG